MATSIASAQSAALAEGFLDQFAGGGDETAFKPAEVVGELIQLAFELVESAQTNLNATHSNASGSLNDSIKMDEPKSAGGIISIDIEMNYYGQFINRGVKGVKSGAGEFAFKHSLSGGRKAGSKKGSANSGKKHKLITALETYVKDAKSKITSTNTKKTTSGYELKNASLSEANNVFGMAKSILDEGIKATHFMDKAIEETNKKIEGRLSDAVEIDILNSLPDNLN